MNDGLVIDAQSVIKNLTDFVVRELSKLGVKKIIISLEGDIDSIVGVYLATKAVGSQNTIALIMPYKDDEKEKLIDSEVIARLLGVDFRIINVSPAIDLYFSAYPNVDGIRLNNKIVFERFSILYDTALIQNGLIISTENRAKFIFGKTTSFYFNGRVISPFLKLYRTQIKQIAKSLGVPEKIINRDSYVDFPEKTSIKIGNNIAYDDVDRLLYLMIDKNYNKLDVAEMGFNKSLVDSVWNIANHSIEKIKQTII